MLVMKFDPVVDHLEKMDLRLMINRNLMGLAEHNGFTQSLQDYPLQSLKILVPNKT
jgi:hypothetical protein